MSDFKQKFKSIVLWSLIAAAFIGPGTVTTASLAGASYNYALIWALVFASLTCFVLQEASARISIVSGNELPSALLSISKSNRFMRFLVYLIAISVVIGCIAYQAGNMTGALSGIQLFSPANRLVFLSFIFVVIFLLLYSGSYQKVAMVLSILVAIMGFSFIYIVINGPHNWAEVGSGMIPTIPENSWLILMGLIGTTIVPYNLFLGSGLGSGQTLNTMRFGLFISIIIGGIISISILINGSLIDGEFSFVSLAESLNPVMGNQGALFLGIGLFAAGFTSSVTSPMAAAILAKGFIQNKKVNIYRLTWLIVLFSGLFFSMLDFKPIPLIVLAQALNGMILPLAVILIWITVNHPLIMKNKLPGIAYNMAFFIVSCIVSIIGLTALNNQSEKLLSATLSNEFIYLISGVISIITAIIIYKVRLLPGVHSS
ncbi:MAG: divalent metal cation transporter [Cyclobacteriaceae bacterium]|nr:divalent metal cation transporter [Cyclobacteriaceae bacterium]